MTDFKAFLPAATSLSDPCPCTAMKVNQFQKNYFMVDQKSINQSAECYGKESWLPELENSVTLPESFPSGLGS